MEINVTSRSTCYIYTKKEQKEKRIEQKNNVWRSKLKREDATIEQETTLGQEIYKLKEDNEELDLSYILKEYKGYLDLFKKIEKDNIALLPHQPWDHEINLVEGKEVLFGPIY